MLYLVAVGISLGVEFQEDLRFSELVTLQGTLTNLVYQGFRMACGVAHSPGDHSIMRLISIG